MKSYVLKVALISMFNVLCLLTEVTFPVRGLNGHPELF